MLTAEDVKVGGEGVAKQPEVSGEKGRLTPELAEFTSFNNPESIHKRIGKVTSEELQAGYDFLQKPSDEAIKSFAVYVHSKKGEGEPYDEVRWVEEARRGLENMRLTWERYISGNNTTEQALDRTVSGDDADLDEFFKEDAFNEIDMKKVLVNTHNLRAAGVLVPREKPSEFGVTPFPNPSTETMVNGSAVQAQDLGAVRDALVVASGDTGATKLESTPSASAATGEKKRGRLGRIAAAFGIGAAAGAVAVTAVNKNEEHADPNASQAGKSSYTEARPGYPAEPTVTYGPEMPLQGPQISEVRDPKPDTDMGAPAANTTLRPDPNIGAPAVDSNLPDASGTKPANDQTPDIGGQGSASEKSPQDIEQDRFVNNILADVVLQPGENTESTLAARIRAYNTEYGTNIDPNVATRLDDVLRRMRDAQGLGPNQPNVPFEIQKIVRGSSPELQAEYNAILQESVPQVQLGQP